MACSAPGPTASKWVIMSGSVEGLSSVLRARRHSVAERIKSVGDFSTSYALPLHQVALAVIAAGALTWAGMELLSQEDAPSVGTASAAADVVSVPEPTSALGAVPPGGAAAGGAGGVTTVTQRVTVRRDGVTKTVEVAKTRVRDVVRTVEGPTTVRTVAGPARVRTVSGPTRVVTAPARVVTAPPRVVTAPGRPVPGPRTTVTVAGPAVRVPGPTVTVQVPGPAVTVHDQLPAETVTVQAPTETVTVIANDGGNSGNGHGNGGG